MREYRALARKKRGHDAADDLVELGAAVVVEIVDLGGDGSRPERHVPHRVRAVGREVALRVAPGAQDEDFLPAQIGADVGVRPLRVEEVVLDARRGAKGVSRARLGPERRGLRRGRQSRAVEGRDRYSSRPPSMTY